MFEHAGASSRSCEDLKAARPYDRDASELTDYFRFFAGNRLMDSENANQANELGDSASERETVRPNRLWRFAVKVLRIVGLAYAAVLVTLVVMETRLVYPGAFMQTGRVQPNSNIQTVRYESEDGVQLEGRLLHRDSKKPIVLYFHGNGEKAVWLDQWLERLAVHFDANVMAAEFRGYGDDQPNPDEQGVLADCFAARQYLMDAYNVGSVEIILYGRSLGGGCAVALAASGGAKALVLERTFDRLVDVAAGQYPVIPVRWLMRNRYDSITRLSQYDGPLIQLHGISDQLIPIAHAKRLFDSGRSATKHWIAAPGLGHNDHLSTNLLSELARKVNGSILATAE